MAQERKMIKDYSNVGLLEELERMCFLVTNYPHNMTHNARLERVEREMARRLGISIDELDEMHKRI